MIDTSTLRLRPATDADAPHLLAVYAASRAPEMALIPWDEAQKQTFLQFQFEAQQQHYQTEFDAADFLVVEEAGVPVGRLYVDRRADEIRILDLALLPAHQGRGLGTRLLKDLMDEAAAAGKPLRLYVEQYQERALRLLAHLGFVTEEDTGVSLRLAWPPPAVNPRRDS